MTLSAKNCITKTTANLSRLTCSFNSMAHVSAQTRQLLNVGDGNAIIHSEATPARIKTQMDNSVQCICMHSIQWYGGSPSPRSCVASAFHAPRRCASATSW